MPDLFPCGMCAVGFSLAAADTYKVVARFHQARREIRPDMSGTADNNDSHQDRNVYPSFFKYSLLVRAVSSGAIRAFALESNSTIMIFISRFCSSRSTTAGISTSL